MKWYIPSWNGDLRLEQSSEKTTMLSIVKPTPAEIEVLGQMKTEFLSKGWVEEKDWKNPSRWRKKSIEINASIEDVGPIASKIMRPGQAVLTAITFEGGKVVTHSGATSELQEMAKQAVAENATAAATVKRPTPSCPECFPGAIKPATEVLLSFLTEEQHATWAEDRTMLVTGGMSGVQYLLAHRNSLTAQRIGRICYDIEAEEVVHFHDRSVPPEEEVLAAKLILEHREDWLRNEATLFGAFNADQIFKNPFGDGSDGVQDAAFTAAFGMGFAGAHLR